MEKIAEILPVETMFQLRNTCKMWNQEFIPEMRKKHAPLHLKGHGTYEKDDGMTLLERRALQK